MSRPSIDYGGRQSGVDQVMAISRKPSTSKESDHSVGHGPPSLSLPHRRMSRVDPSHMMAGMRRMSFIRRQSVASFRTDNSSLKAPVKLVNTYRMEPKDGESFNASRVERLLQNIMDAYFVGEEYDAKQSGFLAKNLTDVIKNRMKELKLPRYKYVCHVFVGENCGQSLQTATRCVWNTSTDNFASATFKSASLWAVANVFACYFE